MFEDLLLCNLQVLECHLVVDPRTKESRGFGFVTMDSFESAERCIKHLNKSALEGRIITVEKVWASLVLSFVLVIYVKVPVHVKFPF